MKYLPIVLLSMAVLACQQEEPAEKVMATLFGEGTISSELPEFATTINAEENLLFFNRTTPDRSSIRILYSERTGDQWSAGDTLAFSTGEYLDIDPFLSVDGQRLYFSSDRPVDTTGIASEQLSHWYVERLADQSWSEPRLLDVPLNSDSTDYFITFAASGNAYFLSERGERGIVVCRFENGAYQQEEAVILKLRGEPIYASNPCIAADESFLIVAARDPEGNGTADLFISWNNAGKWSELINLGEAINSPYTEFAPGLSKDNQVLYFTSERPGLLPEQEEGVRPPGDIYQVDLKAVLDPLRE